MERDSNKRYFKWGLTALVVIFISILLVVIFTNLPGFFALLTSIGKILSPLISGVVIAFLLNPLVNFVDCRLGPLLQKKLKVQTAKNLSRAAGIVMALIVAGFLVYGFFAMLLPQLYESVMNIVDNASTYFNSIETWATNILEDNPEIQGYVDKGLEQLRGFFENWVKTTFLSDMSKLVTTVSTSVIAVVKSLTNFIIGLVASIYMLWSKDTFRAQTKKIMVATMRPSAADRLLALGRNAYRIFNGFIIGKLIDSAIIGVLCYIGCEILKMPFTALVATIVGVTNVIPFFGPIIGAVPSAFLILLVDPLKAFYFVIFVIVLQQLDGNVIGPKILGNTVGISGFWVLASITIAASIFGFGRNAAGCAGVCADLRADLGRRERTAAKEATFDRDGGLPRHPDRGGSGDAAARAACGTAAGRRVGQTGRGGHGGGRCVGETLTFGRSSWIWGALCDFGDEIWNRFWKIWARGCKRCRKWAAEEACCGMWFRCWRS